MWNSRIPPVFFFFYRSGYRINNITFTRNLPTKLLRIHQIPKRTMSAAKWMAEKNRMMNMPLEEKRKLYKSPTFVTVDDIPTWKVYAETQLKDIEKKKPNLDDVHQFGKIKINKELNISLVKKVAIFKGDITQLEVDAVVNAANSRLKAGGGVDGAIHRAAGPFLQMECDALGGCPVGEAKITGGYNLPAKYVIHTVGPQDQSKEALAKSYESSLAFCSQYNIQTIAFPCISTGIYGFPNRLAAHIALKSARLFLEKHPMNTVVFCLFMPVDIEIYETLMQMYFPVLKDVMHSDGFTLTE